MTPLFSPDDFKQRLPTNASQQAFLERSRKTAIAILQKKDPRFVCIVGPCSIHSSSAALDYAAKLKRLSQEIGDSLFLVLRIFCEKPRTKTGWKGMLYDPHLDGSYDVGRGLMNTRSLLLSLAELEIPCATEFLDPIAAPYYEDLISWGFIGARTSASQPHRQLASSFSFPVGFKNTILGDIDPAFNGISSAKQPHVYLGIDQAGRASILKSQGNPYAHLVLRGSEAHPNYDRGFVQETAAALHRHKLPARLLIDCSHGNSGKDHRKQRFVFESLLEQFQEGVVCGAMLESNLYAGKQAHLEDPRNLAYGVSITDSCIGWEETEELLLSASCVLSPTSISSVQN